jgi:hypothetical protein
MYCERSDYRGAKSDSSIDATTMKTISQVVHPHCIVKPKTDFLKFRNYDALGSLGNCIHVTGYGRDPLLSNDALKIKPGSRTTIRASSVDAKSSPAVQPAVEAPQSSVEKPIKFTIAKKTGSFEETMARYNSLGEIRSKMKEKTSSLAALIKKPKMGLIEGKAVESDQQTNQRFRVPASTGIPARRFTIDNGPKKVFMRKLPGSGVMVKKEEIPAPRLSLQAPEPKPLGLQIQNVFSLSTSEIQGRFSDGNFSE